MTNAQHRRPFHWGNFALTTLSVVLMLIILLPVVWMVVVSFKSEGTQFSNALVYFSPPYTIENYMQVLTRSVLPRWVFNSFLVAALVTVGMVLLCTMASYALAKLNFRGKSAWYIYFLLGLMVPGEATIVPLFVMSNSMNLLDSYAGLILPALASSMNIIIMRSFFMGIPNDLIESATIDGASEFSIFKNVILPLGRTVMVTVAIFTFIGNWNSYLWPYLCALNEDMFTLPVGIPTFIKQHTVDMTMPMTVNTLASVPILIFFVIFEKQIVKGISLSGIKG